MSRERFEWLKRLAGEVIATPGGESNVKEIFDKCWELRNSGEDLRIFNQIDKMGNPPWHYTVTGHAIETLLQRYLWDGRQFAGNMYQNDFLLTWDHGDDEIAAVFQTAEILRSMRGQNISSRVFDSGLAISLFRDNSTRTRFSFSSAANLLGLNVQDLDEGKSQIAHGETVRETANIKRWNNVPNSSGITISRGSTHLKKSCWLRMLNLKIGNVRNH